MKSRNQRRGEATRRQRVRRALLIASFIVLPATLFYFSPFLFLEGAAEGRVTGSALLFASLFLSSLLLGRAFCGWVCPGGGFNEVCASAIDRPVPTGWRRAIKFVVWVPWISAFVLFMAGAGGVAAIEPGYRTHHGLSVTSTPGLLVYFAVVTVFLVPALIVGRRGFCHTLCWMAPFMILGRKLSDVCRWPSLHLRPEPSRCVGCQRCAKVCPMSLDVPRLVMSGDMSHVDCILCGSCVDGCNRAALSFGFGERGCRELGPAPEAEKDAGLAGR